ncbi:MAG: response regulator transcription factor [Lachnospiraceae bacterium]|nr:response regulator transcription factor [Lachnospiraceae bacterium]
MRLLLAEDEEELSEALAAVLRHNNYSVDTVFDGQEALDYLEGQEYDGVILDIMMPKKNGIEVLKTVRAGNDPTPILLLTAKSEIDDKVLGLDSGANDYLTKPFATKELLARIRAMTRTTSVQTDSNLHAGNLTLNCSGFELIGPKGQFKLANKEFQMLEMLMRNPHKLISTESFMDRIWGYESETELNVVWVYISYLRKKLSSVGANVQIKAQRGIGYYLEVES